MSLQDELMIEVAKIDRRKKYQLKTSYGRNDMKESYAIDKVNYLKDNSNSRSFPPSLNKSYDSRN